MGRYRIVLATSWQSARFLHKNPGARCRPLHCLKNAPEIPITYDVKLLLRFPSFPRLNINQSGDTSRSRGQRGNKVGSKKEKKKPVVIYLRPHENAPFSWYRVNTTGRQKKILGIFCKYRGLTGPKKFFVDEQNAERQGFPKLMEALDFMEGNDIDFLLVSFYVLDGGAKTKPSEFVKERLTKSGKGLVVVQDWDPAVVSRVACEVFNYPAGEEWTKLKPPIADPAEVSETAKQIEALLEKDSTISFSTLRSTIPNSSGDYCICFKRYFVVSFGVSAVLAKAVSQLVDQGKAHFREVPCNDVDADQSARAFLPVANSMNVGRPHWYPAVLEKGPIVKRKKLNHYPNDPKLRVSSAFHSCCLNDE
jgi:hypothetical protein